MIRGKYVTLYLFNSLGLSVSIISVFNSSSEESGLGHKKSDLIW